MLLLLYHIFDSSNEWVPFTMSHEPKTCLSGFVNTEHIIPHQETRLLTKLSKHLKISLD